MILLKFFLGVFSLNEWIEKFLSESLFEFRLIFPIYKPSDNFGLFETLSFAFLLTFFKVCMLVKDYLSVLRNVLENICQENGALSWMKHSWLVLNSLRITIDKITKQKRKSYSFKHRSEPHKQHNHVTLLVWRSVSNEIVIVIVSLIPFGPVDKISHKKTLETRTSRSKEWFLLAKYKCRAHWECQKHYEENEEICSNTIP
jgi:hypothetical protein